MLLRASVLVAGLALATTTVAGQGCVIDVDHPPQIYGAKVLIGKLADEGDLAHISEKPKHFVSALRLLYEETTTIDNQIARYYMLGKTYAVWLKIDMKGWSSIVPRKKLGFFENQNGTQDMYMAIDTAFNKVEAMNAACADSTSKYRQGVSAIVYNQANDALNAKKYDTAVVLARRALVVNPKGAAPWNVIAAASQGKGDTASYKAALKKVSESTETDAAMVKVRGQAYYNLAVMTLSQAAKKDGDERKALASEAEQYLREFLKLRENDAGGQAALSQALQLKGDTAEARKMMDNMLNDPAKFNATTLFVAAGSSYASQQYDNAVKLYQAGLTKNPFYRDALFSLASTYVSMGKYEEAVPVSAKLLSVDPNSVDTYTQAWNVWRGVNKGTNEALKAVGVDSAVRYGDLRLNAPVVVKMSPDFEITPEGAAIEGVISNRSDAAKSYSITFEFLNATGGVVATTVVPVADVPAKTGKPFSVKATGKGIVAWRYKPIQ